jgi:hypothetical protein
VVLRNPLRKQDLIDYTIDVLDTAMGRDWYRALQNLLRSGRMLEKNYCFMGFPRTARDLPYLCDQLNQAVTIINTEFDDYHIEEQFTPDTVRATDYAPLGPNHDVLNRLHNHFERLQGTVENLSPYYLRAGSQAKYAIRQLNNICHEMETLILSQRKAHADPYWVRPSQITTWLGAERYDLEHSHRQDFVTNGYDRVLGGVYMHWTQIGKTLFEVFRDEAAPELSQTVCEAITHLQYYSGEFDVEWGNDVIYGGGNGWHDREQEAFHRWLRKIGFDPADPRLSLGYLPLGQVDLVGSFGTKSSTPIWNLLGDHLDIYQIEAGDVTQTFDYCWTDPDYQHQQIARLQPGYQYHALANDAVS